MNIRSNIVSVRNLSQLLVFMKKPFLNLLYSKSLDEPYSFIEARVYKKVLVDFCPVCFSSHVNSSPCFMTGEDED